MDDERFNAFKVDPKFRYVPKSSKKVKIGKRFQSVFTDSKFKAKSTVDKYGRPVNTTSDEDFKRFYGLSSEESSSESDSIEEENERRNVKKTEDPESVEENEEVGKYIKVRKNEAQANSSKSKNKNKIPEKIRNKLRDLTTDYARGESNLLSEESSSDDDESVESEYSDNETVEHKWGELANDAETTEEVTDRLAVCNMDWDRIRAVDLMVLLNSFLPPKGFIKSVVIYPSEFGKQRMKEEEEKGPVELVEKPVNDSEVEEKSEEGSKYHMEKLRQYQLNRLKYYYGVVTFDSAETANKVYSECDGMEYESSATKLDLRFIPDDMEFNNDESKEECDELPDFAKYQPRFFTTTALQQAKVDLTWDETDPSRVEITQKLAKGKIEELNEKELQNILAEGSSDEEGESDGDLRSESENYNAIDKYRALLQEIDEKEKKKKELDIDMEAVWDNNVSENEGAEKPISKQKEDKTPFEKYIEKRKEKRKERKEQKKLKSQETENDDSESDLPFGVDLNDPYYKEEFDKPEFKSNKKIKHKKEPDEVDPHKQAELELLLLSEDNDKKHFSLKQLQEKETLSKRKKNKLKKKGNAEHLSEDNFVLDINDERFSALFTNSNYNIDPEDPHFKKTKAMETLISEKLKRRIKHDEYEDKKKIKTSDNDVNSLIKNIAQKAKIVHVKLKK